MPVDSIKFACPACGTRLTVKASMAGVAGPCPSCRARIQAPTVVVSQPADFAQRTLAPMPAPRPYPPPAPIAEAPPQVAADAHGGPSLLRPTPRQLPAREVAVQPVRRPVAEAPQRLTSDRRPVVDVRRAPHASRAMRWLLPIGLVAILACVMLAVLMLAKQSQSPAVTIAEQDLVGRIIDEPPVPGLPHTNNAENLPVTAAPMPDPQRTGLQPANEDPLAAPGLRAMIALEEFLETGTLEERLPRMETRAELQDFTGTPLERPFPAVVDKSTFMQQTNSIERFTDVFFHVDFQRESGGVDMQTIAVRLRGGDDPKILGDPLLDLFGGRVERYAAAPQSKSAIFQVIVTPLPHCHDPKVPNRDRKRTLRILAREDGPEIARAHFGRRSTIGEMVENPISGLSFGQPRAVTMLVQWNTQEDPERPFFEALDIRKLNWNP